MKRKSAPGVGPYSIVLVGLFVLVSLAVRTWQPVVVRPLKPLHDLSNRVQSVLLSASDHVPSRKAAKRARAKPPKSSEEKNLIDAYAIAPRSADMAGPVADRTMVAPSFHAREVPPAPEPPLAPQLFAARTPSPSEPSLQSGLPS